jgi:hypothetical protein
MGRHQRLSEQAEPLLSARLSLDTKGNRAVMSLKKSLLSLFGLLLLGITAFAQEPTAPSSPSTPTPPIGRDGMRQQRMRLRQRRLQQDRLRIGQALQLTDEQRQLRATIRQKQLAATKSQREQLFQLREKRRVGSFSDQDRLMAQQLRAEMRKAMATARMENLNMLTNAQRERLKTMREQRKQMFQERQQRRLEMQRNRPIG